MLKKSIVLFLFIFTALQAQNINIAVAANVSYAMKELIKNFNEMHPNIKVRVTLGSSGKLTAQIIHGAPYDLFMSANMLYPNNLHKKNLTLDAPKIYAQGSLAMLSSKPQDFTLGLALLKEKNIKKIAIANPKTAPYGKAAKQALEKTGMYSAIKSKLVYGESISQTVSYTVRATDIGLIATSSLYSSKMQQFKPNIHWKKIDSTLYTPINQGMVILKQSKNTKAVKSFYDFILSKQAKDILKAYGYTAHE